MLNQIELMGRLTRDPDLRYTQSQTPVTSASIAVDRDYKTSNGEKITDFFDLVIWRNTGEFVAKNFKKGDPIIVVGSMETREWNDRLGNKHKAYEVNVESAYFAGPSNSTEKAENPFANIPYPGAEQ